MHDDSFLISKEEFDLEKPKHLHYLAQKDFEIQIPINKYTEEEILDDLRNLGHWYQALEFGKIKPITKSQFWFVETLNGRLHHCGQIGKNWFYYKRVFNSWGELFNILNKCDSVELETLSEIIKIKENTPAEIISKLETLSQNLVEILDSTSYRQILLKVQKKLKLDSENLSNKNIERAISIKVLEETLSKLSPEERENFEKEVLNIANKEGHNLFKPGAVFATLMAANLSGFGVYMLATTTLSTLSGIIGVTLPFAAYTGLTSAISILTGPPGWIGAGVFALWKITDVKYNKLIPAIIYIHWLREKYGE